MAKSSDFQKQSSGLLMASKQHEALPLIKKKVFIFITLKWHLTYTYIHRHTHQVQDVWIHE